MLNCGQTECRYCFKHYTGSTVCNSPGEPVLCVKSDGLQPDILQCVTFRKREGGICELQPGRLANGLYPGQLTEPN